MKAIKIPNSLTLAIYRLFLDKQIFDVQFTMVLQSYPDDALVEILVATSRKLKIGKFTFAVSNLGGQLICIPVNKLQKRTLKNIIKWWESDGDPNELEMIGLAAEACFKHAVDRVKGIKLLTDGAIAITDYGLSLDWVQGSHGRAYYNITSDSERGDVHSRPKILDFIDSHYIVDYDDSVAHQKHMHNFAMELYEQFPTARGYNDVHMRMCGVADLKYLTIGSRVFQLSLDGAFELDHTDPRLLGRTNSVQPAYFCFQDVIVDKFQSVSAEQTHVHQSTRGYIAKSLVKALKAKYPKYDYRVTSMGEYIEVTVIKDGKDHLRVDYRPMNLPN